MGGLGISNGSYWHLNNQNPAALVYNRFTVFEMGLSADVRQIINITSKDINGNGNINHIGFEPSKNVHEVAKNNGINSVNIFFDSDSAEEIRNKHGRADIFVAANVMCHIPEIISVVKGIDKILKDEGIVIFEDPYLGDVIKKTSFDQIYDEHTLSLIHI